MGATAAVLVVVGVVTGGAVTGATTAVVSGATGGCGGTGGSGTVAVARAGARGSAGDGAGPDFAGGIAASAFSARSKTFSRGAGDGGLLTVLATSLDCRADFPGGPAVAVAGASTVGTSMLLVPMTLGALPGLGASVVTCAAGGVAAGCTSDLPDGHN